MVHADLEPLVCPGGLFDIEPCHMDLNIGRRGRWLNPDAPWCGTIHKEQFTVVGVQKDWKARKCYRVVPDSDEQKFGLCAHPDEIELL